MENNAKNDVIEKVNELIEAPSCCPEAKAAAQSWLDSIGTDEEAAKAKALIAELEQDTMPVEELLAAAEAHQRLLGRLPLLRVERRQVEIAREVVEHRSSSLYCLR